MAELKEELKGADVVLADEVQTLMKAGVHIGHAKSKTHPMMRPFIFTTRNNIQIIDVLKTKAALEKAETFLSSVAARGGMVLWVGTKPSARAAVESAARETGMPWITGRWIGGLLTNFKVIARQIAEMEEIEARSRSGDLEKYTKHERAKIENQYQSLLKVYSGLRAMKRPPDALIVIDMVHDHLAVSEARRLKIPVVALADTNSNPALVQYPIPSNDDARLAVLYMTERFMRALLEGKTEAERMQSLAKEAETKAAEEAKTGQSPAESQS